jgi:hypothetical protein
MARLAVRMVDGGQAISRFTARRVLGERTGKMWSSRSASRGGTGIVYSQRMGSEAGCWDCGLVSGGMAEMEAVIAARWLSRDQLKNGEGDQSREAGPPRATKPA